MQPPDVTVPVTAGQVLSDAGCQGVRDAWRPSFHPSCDRTSCPGHWHHQDHASPSCSCCSTACSRRINGSRRAHCASGNSPEPITKSHDPVLVPSGLNPLVMLVRHLLLGVTICLQDLFFFVATISVASSSWQDLCGDHRPPASRHRWLSSPSLPCSAHLCLAVRLFSFRSFLIVLAILPCSWVCSSARHVVDSKRFLSVLLNTPESSSDQCFPTLPPSRAVSATNPFSQHSSFSGSVTRCFALRLRGEYCSLRHLHTATVVQLVAPSLTPRAALDVHLLLLF